MEADTPAPQEVVDLHERFCRAFEARNAAAVMELIASDTDIIVVTSEEALLRGMDELQAFLDAYVDGPTTYSWEWTRRDVSIAGPVAWLLAEGSETTSAGDVKTEHPYRMTIVCEQRGDHWFLVHAHGSSPHT